LIEKTYDVEFDESNGSKGAHENLDDVGDELLREVMKNILVGDIKPKDGENEVHVIDPPFSSSVPQYDGKDGRVENEDTHISHDQMVAQAQDVEAPQPPPQVVDRRNSPLLQAHPQDEFTSTSSTSTRSHHRESFKGCNDSLSKTCFIC
jgi:hypothetical protein